MKRTFTLPALVLFIVLGSSWLQSAVAQYNQNDSYTQDDQYSPNDRNREVSYQDFYDQLSPYGQWVDHPDHGYIWIPDAGPDFRPYSTEGHWVWTEDAEWMWVSDYDWGWAPFHYGRWDQDQHYGWYWVPGYEWSPAWVAWRDGGDYYGWAPIRPGISINVNYNMGSYAPPYDFWSFTPRRYILYPRVRDYCVDYRRNSSIFSVTTVINFNIGGRWGYRSGPSRWEAERYCGRITPVRFRDSYSPGRTYFRNNEVRIYRPNVRRDEGRGYAPQRFERYDRNRDFRTAPRNNGNGRINNGGANGRPENGNRNNGFGRNENGNRDNGRINDTRGGRPVNRDFRTNGNGDRQPQSGGTPNNNTGGRRFERNDNNSNNGGNNPRMGGSNNPRTGPGADRPQRRPDNGNSGNTEPRRFERRNDNGGGAVQGNNNRSIERRPVSSGSNGQQRMERRTAPQSQPAQRQVERRSENSGGNGGGNSGGNGRRRF
ncbi:MAG TPA: hypothetical protein PLU11_02320 [Chitinophagaceae bacterium]|nr:hypothetical protein [Chitinophagaceae bacterium]